MKNTTNAKNFSRNGSPSGGAAEPVEGALPETPEEKGLPPEETAEPTGSEAVPTQPTGEQPASEESAPEENAPETLRARITGLEGEVEKYKDLFLRKAAEFENYKRRMESEVSQTIRFAAERLLLQFLPVADDVDRTLKAAQDSSDYEALLKGIELVSQKLLKTLETQGVTPFDSMEKEFSVDFHDALMMLPRSDCPPNTVTEEVERGYMIGDKVLRHAKVIVSAPALDDHEQASGTDTAQGGS